MTTYNTGNPVPSANAKDRFDNSQTFDEVMNGSAFYYMNRTGSNILSMSGMVQFFYDAQADRAQKFEAMKAEFDADQSQREETFNQFLINTQFEMPPIPYQEGGPIEVSRPAQLISHEGQLYSVKLPASFPFQLSGIWDVAVVSLTPREDASLRQQLAAPTGAGMAGFARSEVDRQITNVGQMLSAGAVNLWEFAELAVGYVPAGNTDLWDWKPAIIAACAKGPIVTGGGRKYRTSNILIPYSVDLREAWFLPHSSVTGQHLITMSGADSKVCFGIDADGKGIGGLEAAGDWITGTVAMQNVVGQPQATGGTQGCIKVSGSNCQIGVFARNIHIGTSTNTSIPRVATTDNTNLSATNNTITIYAYDVQCGWVTTQENVRCETLFIDGVKDNGIYHLQGAATAGAVTVRNCDDEPVVAKQGLHIDNLTIDNCNGFTSLSGEAATVEFSVGNYNVISSDPTKTYRPLTVRAANVNAKARIGLLQGRVNLVKDTSIGGIFQIEAGSMDRLDVEDINLEVHYLQGSTKILANMSRLKSFYIGNLTIRFIDDTGTLTFADKVDFRLPTVITGFSYIGKVTLISDSAELRIANVSHPMLQFGPNMELTTNAGPYIVQQNKNFPAPRLMTSTGVPTAGTWLRGDRIAIKAPFPGGVVEYVCIEAGAPGAWRACKWVTGRGPTSSRPVLTANDVGVDYMDVTLAAGGRSIKWNGAAWVDYSGVVL